MNDLARTILDLRNLWAHAVLATELARGREQGYLPGDPISERVDPTSLASQIGALDQRPSEGTPMGRIASRFELSPSEEDTLWLLTCCELEPDLAHFVEHLASQGMHQLSVQHVQRMVGASLASLDRLARFMLVELEHDPRTPIHRRRVRVADRVLELLRGTLGLDPAIRDVASIVPERASAGKDLERDDACIVVMLGADAEERDEAIIADTSMSIVRVDCARIPHAGEKERTLGLLAREARLLDAQLLFSGADALLVDDAFYRAIANVKGPVYATASTVPMSAGARPFVVHELAPIDRTRRTQRWRAALPTAAGSVIDNCADQYRLPSRVIADVGHSLRATATPTVSDVQGQLRRRLDQRLHGFAKRVTSKQSWADLVLPPDQFDLLVELVARVRHRRQVIETWGFGAKVGKGAGTTALFSGPPGTGKTMIAGLLANELELDLYQADLSKIVSKYIGETEQRLAELFDAAEHGQAIILFDEADSLFGRRTEVRSSNDRYANLETNYLLQRLEAFDGIAILTTNHETAIDAAFMRRLSVHVRVPMPDEEHRAKLWEAMIPAAAAVRGAVDFAGLAGEFVMSGGYIKNAVLRAAYLAAAETEAIEDSHLWRAARAEYESMGKLSSPGR